MKSRRWTKTYSQPTTRSKTDILFWGALLFAALGLVAARAHLAAAGEVSFSHVHLLAPDPLAVQRFWSSVFGAKPAKSGSLEGVSLGQAYVWIEKGEPVGGTEGSVIRDIGIRVRDLDGTLARAAREGIHGRQTSRTTAQLQAPQNVLLELVSDPAMDSEVAFDHIHFLVPDANLARSWYTERFGTHISGIRLDFVTAGSTAAPTKGRAVDHIGLEVKNLDSYRAPDHALPWESAPADLKSGFFTDPWGARVEVTEAAR